MPQHRVFDMDFDEVSTVDVPANQHGHIVLAKRATTEETTVSDYFDADGNAVDIDQLEAGSVVQDAQGGLFQIQEDDGEDLGDEAYDGAEERELAEVGKSAFFDTVAKSGDTFFASLSSELRKAADDEAREAVLAKALTAQTTELAKANDRAVQAYELAKSLQDERDTAQYIEVAKGFNVPEAPEVLGPVLKRMADTMSYEDCAVIAKLLNTSGDIFKSYGLDGEAGADDPLEQIEAYVNEHASDALGQLHKSGSLDGRTALSKEAAVTAFFDANPSEYAALKRGQR